MNKANNKTSKQQPVYLTELVGKKSPHTANTNTRSSLSLSSTENKYKVFGGPTNMYRSLKPHLDPSENQIYLEECLDRIGELGKLGNFSTSKSKKISDSYYYKVQTKTREKDYAKNLNKQKDNVTQPKVHSQHRPLNYKQSKSKLIPNRKTSKSKHEHKQHKMSTNNTHSNHQSLKRLISSTQLSQNLTKLQTVRTFSPDVEYISEQLTQKRKEKKMIKKQQELLQRVTKILEDYQKIVSKEQKQKQALAKQNRKLREKLQLVNSEKKYKNVLEYRL